jgi:hypothetical protein
MFANPAIQPRTITLRLTPPHDVQVCPIEVGLFCGFLDQRILPRLAPRTARPDPFCGAPATRKIHPLRSEQALFALPGVFPRLRGLQPSTAQLLPTKTYLSNVADRRCKFDAQTAEGDLV